MLIELTCVCVFKTHLNVVISVFFCFNVIIVLCSILATGDVVLSIIQRKLQQTHDFCTNSTSKIGNALLLITLHYLVHEMDIEHKAFTMTLLRKGHNTSCFQYLKTELDVPINSMNLTATLTELAVAK